MGGIGRVVGNSETVNFQQFREITDAKSQLLQIHLL